MAFGLQRSDKEPAELQPQLYVWHVTWQPRSQA